MNGSPAMSGSIAAGVLEAVIAAIYLDSDFEKAKEFVLSSFGDLIAKADAEHHHENFKSILHQHHKRIHCH